MIAWWLGVAFASPDCEPPDRSAPPPVLPSPVLVLPEPEVHTIGPGAEAWFVHVPQVRKVAVEVVFERGMVELAGHPTEALRAMGNMAEVAGGKLDAAELSEALDLYDIELSTSLGLHDGRVSLRVPGEELERGLELQSTILHEATFPKKELDRYLRDQSLFYTVTGPTSQAAVARSALSYAWFPADHPYGQRPNPEELERVKRGALQGEFGQWTTAAPIVAIVVGDVAWADVEPGVTALVQGLGAPGDAAKELPVEPPVGARVVAVDMSGQKQVAVRLRLPAPFEADPDRAAFETATFVLGGTFLSRLNRSLREDKGYTYGADAWYQSGATWGMVTIGVDVGSENLLDTLRTIEAELAALAASGPDEDELMTARRSLAAEWNDTFLTADSATSLYLDVLDEQTTVAARRARVEAIAELTADEVQRVAARWLGAQAPRTWVMVGDRATMADSIAAFGVPAEWTDPGSAILGTFGPPEGIHE